MHAPIILEHMEEVGSTSDILKQRAEAGGCEAALMATRQTGGRGRLNRSWVSPPGNLHLSLLLRPRPPFMPGHWSMLAAVAVAGVVGAHIGGVRLKWPNDVLLHGGKLAGLLLEADVTAGWVVIGVGVNLVHAPPGLGRKVTALGDHGPPPSPHAFASRLLEEVSRWRHEYEAAGFAPIRAAWLGFGPEPGDLVAVGSPAGRIEGRFAGIGTDGALLLDQDGRQRTIHSGEVE